MKLDREEPHPGYWPSPWPVECGGNRRQKAAKGGLNASGRASVVTRRNERWNVMVVRRDPGEWYLQGTMAAFFGATPFGWVERIDATSLEPVSQSPNLPCAATGATLANGMFLTAGDDRDVYYCTTGTLARVSWG